MAENWSLEYAWETFKLTIWIFRNIYNFFRFSILNHNYKLMKETKRSLFDAEKNEECTAWKVDQS